MATMSFSRLHTFARIQSLNSLVQEERACHSPGHAPPRPTLLAAPGLWHTHPLTLFRSDDASKASTEIVPNSWPAVPELGRGKPLPSTGTNGLAEAAALFMVGLSEAMTSGQCSPHHSSAVVMYLCVSTTVSCVHSIFSSAKWAIGALLRQQGPRVLAHIRSRLCPKHAEVLAAGVHVLALALRDSRGLKLLVGFCSLAHVTQTRNKVFPQPGIRGKCPAPECAILSDNTQKPRQWPSMALSSRHSQLSVDFDGRKAKKYRKYNN